MAYQDSVNSTPLSEAYLDEEAKQSNLKYATIAARTADAALTTALREGMESYTDDLERKWIYNGTAWVLTGWGSVAGRPGVALTDVTQTITNATLTDITWGTEVSDPDGWTSGGSATLTVPSGWDGLYLMTFNAAWSTSSLGTAPYIVLNAGGLAYVASGLTDLGRHTVTALVPLAATNTVVCQAKQNSGGSVTVSSRLDLSWVGR